MNTYQTLPVFLSVTLSSPIKQSLLFYDVKVKDSVSNLNQIFKNYFWTHMSDLNALQSPRSVKVVTPLTASLLKVPTDHHINAVFFRYSIQLPLGRSNFQPATVFSRWPPPQTDLSVPFDSSKCPIVRGKHPLLVGIYFLFNYLLWF